MIRLHPRACHSFAGDKSGEISVLHGSPYSSQAGRLSHFNLPSSIRDAISQAVVSSQIDVFSASILPLKVLRAHRKYLQEIQL